MPLVDLVDWPDRNRQEVIDMVNIAANIDNMVDSLITMSATFKECSNKGDLQPFLHQYGTSSFALIVEHLDHDWHELKRTSLP